MSQIDRIVIAQNQAQIRDFLDRWRRDFSTPPTVHDLIAMAVVLEGEASILRLQALQTGQQERQQWIAAQKKQSIEH